jgi:hypothetical protein
LVCVSSSKPVVFRYDLIGVRCFGNAPFFFVPPGRGALIRGKVSYEHRLRGIVAGRAEVGKILTLAGTLDFSSVCLAEFVRM